MQMFEQDSYICIDFPAEAAQMIMKIRADQKDDFRIKLPAEITVAGSSGVGVIARDENPEFVFSRLQEICSNAKPFTIQFKAVERFPNSDIFVFKLVDETPLKELHALIAQSGIRFEPVRHTDYNPHCTLRSRSPVTEEEADALLTLEYHEPIFIDKISIYKMDKLPMTHVFECRLGV